MPPETRAFTFNSTNPTLRDMYQYQYYIPEALEHYLNWIDYSTYQIKFDFSSYKEKSKKALEIE